MLTYESIMKQIKRNKRKIKVYGVDKIGLFGSYVMNEQKAGSDIDILVKFKKNKKTFDNYMDLKFFLEDLFGSKVDLVIAEAIKEDLKPYIMESARYASGF